MTSVSPFAVTLSSEGHAEAHKLTLPLVAICRETRFFTVWIPEPKSLASFDLIMVFSYHSRAGAIAIALGTAVFAWLLRGRPEKFGFQSLADSNGC